MHPNQLAVVTTLMTPVPSTHLKSLHHNISHLSNPVRACNKATRKWDMVDTCLNHLNINRLSHTIIIWLSNNVESVTPCHLKLDLHNSIKHKSHPQAAVYKRGST